MRRLHVISHTHWDREWHRTFQQFRLKLVYLVDGLLELLEKDPDYRYFMLDGQTIVLDDYLWMRPEKEGILREHIRSGRIVIGPWHILPDMFLVGPEAHIRNLLEGRRTCQKYGPRMQVGYMPDSFGHIGQMPQILHGFGIEKACLWRGLNEEPAEFWWQAPDGSRVLMAYLRDSYSNGASLPGGETLDMEGRQHFSRSIAEVGETLAEHSAAQDVLIMLGTDHMQPAASTSASIAYANEHLANTQVIHSTLEKYFDALQASLDPAQLPRVEGELRQCKRMPLLPGVLSTRIWIKQRNQASETLLTRWVEPFSSFAEMVPARGTPLQTPAEIIRQNWRLLMENHPHDSICGCGIDPIHEEMKVRFDQVDQIGEEITQQALERITRNIQTGTEPYPEDSMGAVVIFNPHPFTRHDLVKVEISLEPGTTGFVLQDEKGQNIPFETVGLGAQELLNSRMTPKEFRAALQTVNEGSISGLGIRAYRTVRIAETVELDVTLVEGEPDHKIWERAYREINTLLGETDIRFYHLRAHTPNQAKVIFVTPEIPGLGWKTIFVHARNKASKPMQLSGLMSALLPLAGKIASSPTGKALMEKLQNKPGDKGTKCIENEAYRVEVERAGGIRILDKGNGTVYAGMNTFLDGGDAGDEYNHSAPEVDALLRPRLKNVRVQKEAVCQKLTIEMTLSTPAGLAADRKARSKQTVEIPITTSVTLSSGVPRIDIHTHIRNEAKDHRLRVHFPTPFRTESADYDGHFEIRERKIGIPTFDRQSWVEDPRPEAPQRGFTHVGEETRGLYLANRGLPEVEVMQTAEGTEIALTLLRCVGWLSRDDLQTRRGHAGPGSETPGAQMPGEWEFDYAILPHSGKTNLQAQEEAYAFECGLRANPTSLHNGSLAENGSFLEITCSQAGSFVLSSVKASVDGSGWLVRGYNTGAEEVEVRLTPRLRCASAARINLAEEKVATLELNPENGSVSLVVRGYEIVTAWFENEGGNSGSYPGAS